MRKLIIFALSQLLFLAACGGGDLAGTTGTTGTTTTTGSSANVTAINNTNAISMQVNAGPANDSPNTPFVSVTICAPGSTTNCTTIDNVEVDTGSYGVRIIASVLQAANSTVYNALTPETVSSQNLFACAMFGDGFTWGSMATADVVLGTERAASQSIQLMGDETDNIPSGCSSTGPEEDTVTTFGANGIIGVGPFIQDCGADCTTSTESGIYWSCPAGGGTCGQTVVTLAQQASNPVAAFTTDNNGIILELPSIPDAGAASAAGALVFGIGTESNNALGSASVFGTDDEAFININYKNFTYTEGFIDSGSNLNYFNDGTITTCASGSASIFCPSSELTETALVEGASGSPQVSVTFNVSNPETLEENEPSFTAFDNVAAPPLATPVTSSLESSEEFDLGLPFFYGRNIFTAIEGMNTTGGGEGPYFAF